MTKIKFKKKEAGPSRFISPQRKNKNKQQQKKIQQFTTKSGEKRTIETQRKTVQDFKKSSIRNEDFGVATFQKVYKKRRVKFIIYRNKTGLPRRSRRESWAGRSKLTGEKKH